MSRILTEMIIGLDHQYDNDPPVSMEQIATLPYDVRDHIFGVVNKTIPYDDCLPNKRRRQIYAAINRKFAERGLFDPKINTAVARPEDRTPFQPGDKYWINEFAFKSVSMYFHGCYPTIARKIRRYLPIYFSYPSLESARSGYGEINSFTPISESNKDFPEIIQSVMDEFGYLPADPKWLAWPIPVKGQNLATPSDDYGVFRIMHALFGE